MVQVDVFWSYGIGASFALGAWRQLRKLRAERDGDSWKLVADNKMDVAQLLKAMKKKEILPPKLEKEQLQKMQAYIKEFRETNATAFGNEYFLKTLAFLALLFVPSGAVLLWSNPSWETMQVGKYETIPQWLVGLFSITNVTQGILGYLVTHDYLMKGKLGKAALQTFGAYFLFFFTLVNGWDNKAYQRFFSKNRESFENWKWANVLPWLTSDVSAILISFGTVFLPVIYYLMCKWLVEGSLDEAGELADDNRILKEATRTFGLYNLGIFGGTLGSSIAGTVLIRKLGWIPGLASTAALIYPLLLSEKGPGAVFLKKLLNVDSLELPPVEPASASRVLGETLAAVAV